MRSLSLALLLSGCAVDPTVGTPSLPSDDESPDQTDHDPALNTTDGVPDDTRDVTGGRQAPLSHDGTARWLLAAAGDADGDGFGAAEDCDDADADVNPGAAEDCEGGVDDDCDGALDCEDADCATAPSCVEDCADGVDNDLDGYLDCADDECWGSCGVTVRSSLGGGSADVLYIRGRDSFTSYTTLNITAYSLTGTVSVAGASGTTQCQWTVPEARVAYEETWVTSVYSSSSVVYTWQPAWIVEDAQATFSGGCPLHPDQDVLPAAYKKFTMSDTASWRVVKVSLTTPFGAWYQGDVNIYSYARESGVLYMDGFLPELSPAAVTWSQ
jgi:hypothetical protein